MHVRHLLDDAHRRVCIARQRGQTDRSRIWTGMQYPSAMRQAVGDGLMVPLSAERPRVMGWYRFTEAGWAAYDAAFDGAPDWFDEAYGSHVIDFDEAMRAAAAANGAQVATDALDPAADPPRR